MQDPRLSDQSITDVVWRGLLYKKVIEYVKTQSDVVYYEVRADEQYRPDLASSRIYHTKELRWLVVLVSNNDDEMSPLPVGFQIKLPPITEVRRMIREVKDQYAEVSV